LPIAKGLPLIHVKFKIEIMKKLAYVLGVLFVVVLGMNTYASTSIVINDETVTIVDINDDKKPCPTDCKADCCKAAKADAKTTKADCNKTVKASCGEKSAAKSCCSGSKSAAKTESKTQTTTAKTPNK